MLFITALRLFILLELISEFLAILMYAGLDLSSEYTEVRTTLNTILPTLASFGIYVLIFWKATWIVDKIPMTDVNLEKISIDAKTIVAAGLVLFGVYGVANQTIQWFSLFNYLMGGQFSASIGSTEAWNSFWTGVFMILRLMIYFLCIVGAGFIAEVTTRKN